MLRDKVILVNVIIMIILVGLLSYLVVREYVVERNVVYDTTIGYKVDSGRSVKLTEGYNRQVQHTIPAWALESQYFDDVSLIK